MADAVLDEQALARTYDVPSYADAWDAVEDYRRVMRYKSLHPNKGSHAISTRIELPRSRIRPWLEGAKPDPARAVDVARDLGWATTGYGDRVFDALNMLVANVFSGGSISSDTFQPRFSVDRPETESSVIEAVEAVGLEYRTDRADEDGRAMEFVPTDHTTVLGRALSVLGAPVGEKAGRRSLPLPNYLEDSPRKTREAFVACYLANRGTRYSGKATMSIQEQNRPQHYHHDLGALIRDVADGDVTTSDTGVTISADAARSLEEISEPNFAR